MNKTQKKKQYHIAIIGGGAAGMAAALTASSEPSPGTLTQRSSELSPGVSPCSPAAECSGGSSHTSVKGCSERPLGPHPVPDIIIVEKQDRLGRKLLATGNGRCNLTNASLTPSGYRSEDPAAAGRILSQFGLDNTFDLFRRAGILTKTIDGLVYPYSEQAQTVRNKLSSAVERAEGVDVLTDASVLSISPCSQKEEKDRAGFFRIETGKGIIFARNVIITTGGYAGPSFGCSGDGYRFAGSLGHSLVKPLPALTGLKSGAPFLKKLSGLRTWAGITLLIDEEKVIQDEGQIQWADYGVSGIVVFQVSRYAAIALDQGRQVGLLIDFMPDRCEDDIVNLLRDLSASAAGISMSQASLFSEAPSDTSSFDMPVSRPGRNCLDAGDLLLGIFPDKLVPVLVREARLDKTGTPDQWTDREFYALAHAIKAFPLRIKDVVGYEKAQVTRGGVPLSELDDGLCSRIQPGLYFAGEVIDVDGICGGYNLQWAWSSGAVAGRAARQTLDS